MLIINVNCHCKHNFKYCLMQQKQYTHLPNILVDTWFSTSFDSDAQLITVIVDTTSTGYMSAPGFLIDLTILKLISFFLDGDSNI